MSSRFRNLGPRDRRMNSQWPDFPQVYGDSVRIKSTKCLEPLEGLQKRKGILEDLIFLTLHQNVVQTIKNGIKNLLGKDKAPSPGVSCPWKFRWWGHVRAIRGALYLLQSHRNFIFQSLRKFRLYPVSSPHGHCTQLLVALQRHPAEHLDYLVCVNSVGHKLQSPQWEEDLTWPGSSCRATAVSHCSCCLALVLCYQDQEECSSLPTLVTDQNKHPTAFSKRRN